MSVLWQQIQRKVGVRPDGIPGPATARAVAAALGIDEPPQTTYWPRDTRAEMLAFYGSVGSGHVQIVPPYPLYYDGGRVHRITVHNRIAEPVIRALTKVLEVYGEQRIVDLKLNVYDGCFNPRPKRGGTSLSTHAYAAAIDWCAALNPLQADHTTALFAKPEYEEWFRAWESEGAVSLGRARDFDWMHVQFARLA